jgi:hypothetical protein
MVLADEADVLTLQHVVHNTVDDSQYFGIIPAEQTIIIRVYTDDADDILLIDIKPRFIVMFEPNQEFIRRIEVITPCIVWLRANMSALRFIEA